MNILEGKLWILAIRMLMLLLRTAIRQEHVLSKFSDYNQLSESKKFREDIDGVIVESRETLAHLRDYFGLE